jgi:hypothetical protein
LVAVGILVLAKTVSRSPGQPLRQERCSGRWLPRRGVTGSTAIWCH